MNLSNHFSNILQSACAVSFSLLLILGILSPCVSSSPVATANHNTQQQQQRYTCHPLETLNTACSRWYRDAQLPNIFGHDTLLKAQTELNSAVEKISMNPTDEVLSYMCVIYLPPCSTEVPSRSRSQFSMRLPCRAMCDAAAEARPRDNNLANRNDTENGRRKFRSWPVMCHTLPTQRCYVFERNSGITYTRRDTNIKAKTLVAPSDEIAKVASIETEIGDISSNEGYDIEVVSLTTDQDHGRRYDITDLGDPDLFQGWADVQGIGSANDYCRVVGRSKRKFLSCHLSGNANQGHHYVSKLGFEIGYPGTWFMRDMDGDGKDDYCRCVGSPSNSKVTCMKAGERGFHGSPMQAGSQHSFVLTSSTGCHNTRVNALFGE